MEFAGESRAAVVLKMLDANVEVLAGRKNNAAYSVERSEQAEAQGLGVVGIKPDPVLPAGRLALLNGDEAIRFGLAKLANKDSRQQVAETYGLSAASLREDPLQGRAPVAWVIKMTGKVDGGFYETMTRRIRKAIGRKANILILQLDCGNGDPDTARKMADFLRNLTDDVEHLPVMTIAYIPTAAADTATFIAFGCTEIVMGKNATLGDFSAWLAA